MKAELKESLTGQGEPLSGRKITSVSRVGGGSSLEIWRVTLNDDRKIFAKTAEIIEFPKLEFEAEGLLELKRFSNTRLLEIPKPIAIRKYEMAGVLLLPWIDIQSGNQELLGEGLATLHKQSTNTNHTNFGWGSPGFIGEGPQDAGWNEDWGIFFVKNRLIPQLKIANKWGIRISELNKVLQDITLFLNKHKTQPSLVHGDLWSGNIAVLDNNKGVMFDPAIWWADREVDLAMTKLFGGFSNDFYKGYEKIWPLKSSAHERIEIYNLYHIINHANIFGGGYINQSISLLKKLARKLS